MSTKLYGGIKFKTKNIFELYEQFMEIKPKAVQIGLKILSNVEDLKYFIILNKLQKADKYDIVRQLNVSLNKQWRTIDDNNVLFSVMIFPYKNELYGYRFDDDVQEYQELLTDIADDFHYQNQCDRPKHITEEEWDEREKIWNDILEYDSFSQRGFKFEFVSAIDLMDYQYRQSLFEGIEKALEELNKEK